MSLDRSGLSADEYYVTALQIFDYCGAESTSTLRVDALMDKFAPFVKTNKAEYSYLKSLLDPDEDNPEISVTMLAKTLHKYSESQKSKVDLDESFNLLKSGQVPQDSDSGISTDGFQLLEELQCELREKAHLAHQLRSQLDFTDRQHEEALAALTAERDTLRSHLNMMREENMSLTHLRRDYEEVCERLCTNDRALDEVRRELEAFRRRNKVMVEQVSSLENEKLTLQELLTKSKAECHRINEMYAARQSSLLEQNEALRTEHADLSARLQDQEEFVQQMIKEKVLLEMELKDLLNKSNQTQLRMDRSIDISYTEDQMLTALDSLNVDSRFSQDNRILDEESFINALKEDQGRGTNLSLFDEIRLSFCNMSRLSTTGVNSLMGDKHDSFTCEKPWDNSFTAVETQTEIETYDYDYKTHLCLCVATGTQTDPEPHTVRDKDKNRQIFIAVETQTKFDIDHTITPLSIAVETQTEFESYNEGRKIQIRASPLIAVETQTESESYNEGHKIPIHASPLIAVETQTEFESYTEEHNIQIRALPSLIAVETQIEFDSYSEINKVQIKRIESSTSTENEPKDDEYRDLNLKTTETQTDDIDKSNNNNSCSKCLECEKANKYTAKLERDVHMSRYTVSEMQLELDKYENNLDILQNFVDEGNERNSVLQAIIKSLEAKIDILELACAKQKERLDGLTQDEFAVKNICDQSSVSTQVDIPCMACEKRNAVAPQRSLRKFFWTPLKCLFQVFAVACFLLAVSLLYDVTSRSHAWCERGHAVPWRWLQPRDLLDLLLRVEYVSDVPM